MATSDSPLNVPNVTLAVARGSASGGTNALSWTALDGNTNNGSRLRISSDGSFNLGTKPGGPQELHDFVHTTYERGVENTFNAGMADDTAFANTEADRIYFKMVQNHVGLAPLAMKSDVALQRHPNASRLYRLVGDDSQIKEPYGFMKVGREMGYKKLYHGWWQKVKYNAAGWRDVFTNTATGTFIPGETLYSNTSVFGEIYGVYVGKWTDQTVTIDNTGAYTGDIHRVVLNAWSNDAFTNSGYSAYGPETVTGLTSGASFTFEAATTSAQYKIGRWWDAPDGSRIASSFSIIGIYMTDQGAGVTTVEATTFSDPVMFVMKPDQWQFVEVEVDWMGGFFRHSVDGVVRHELYNFDPGGGGDPLYSLSPDMFGTNSGGRPFDEQITDIAEVIFDRTLERVYLTNAPTWDFSAHKEVQRLIAWDGTVDIALNYGQLSSGWLYLIGADGQPINTTGLEVV